MKKILIFTSDGAGGHTATTKALTAYLHDAYVINPINVFKDILGTIDAIKILSLGTLTGENFYEQCLTRKYYSFLNYLHGIGKWYFKKVQKQLSKRIEQCLRDQQPDLIISVVPLVDGALVAASQKLGIPFLLIPTDFDCTNYIHDIANPLHPKFQVTLPFEDKRIRDLLEPAKIDTCQIVTTGFPIRQDFFEPKDYNSIKKAYNIPHGKPVIFLLMGSVGSQSLYTFTQQLAQLDFSVHLLICVGRFAAIKEKLNTIVFNTNVTVTIVDFVQKISDLMAIADLLITKAGPVSMSEAIYMNLPMLVDVTSKTLDWERLNYEFITQRQFGKVVTNTCDLKEIVTQLFAHDEELIAMKQNLVSFEKKHGCNEVRKIIEQMI